MTHEPEDGIGEVVGACVLVPEGKYEVAYLSYETGKFFGQPKVMVHFSIINHDTYAGTPVDRFYNAMSLIGPPKRFGKYKAACRGDLVREHSRLVGEQKRSDRISFAILKEKCVLAQIDTVTRDYRNQPLPQDEQYSRISKLLEILSEEY